MNAEGTMAVDNEFPAGMHVLAVDKDPTALKMLETMLQKCQYKATTTTDVETAMNMLRGNPKTYDLVMTDVKTGNMDGFKLLELVGHKMNLPIIMLSADRNPILIMEGIKHGACDYLAKPVLFEEIKKIWQHVYRRWLKSVRPGFSTVQGNVEPGAAGNGGQQEVHNGHEESSRDRNRQRNGKRGGRNQENRQESEDSPNQKRRRLVWSAELHDKFVAAVDQLRFESVTPKRIVELMDVEGITKENVASHLQKYRRYLKRMDEENGQQVDIVADFGALTISRRHPSPYISPSYQQGGILGSTSNPTEIAIRNTALSQAIVPYSGNTMFQPIDSQTTQSNNHPRDLTIYTSPSWVSTKQREDDESSM